MSHYLLPRNSEITRCQDSLRDLLLAWIPTPVAAVATCSNNDLPIFLAEKELVISAVPRRQADFIGGRWCAHRCIEQLGYIPEPILVNPFGGPTWPVGFVGSITHESGICIAVVAQRSVLNSIGIDLFDARRDCDMHELRDNYLTHREQITYTSLGQLEAQVLFSIKESVIKLFSGELGWFLDMKTIDVMLGNGTFTGEIHPYGCRANGYWGYLPPFILTAAVPSN